MLVLLVLSFVFKQNLFTSSRGGIAPRRRSRQYSGEADRDAGENARGAVRLLRARRRAEDLGAEAARAIPSRQARAVPRLHAVRLRRRRNRPPDRSTVPEDEKVYIDLSFFDELSQTFGAPGRIRAGICDRARARPSCAETARHRAAGQPPAAQRSVRAKPALRAAWNCRPIVSPASGGIRPRSAISSIRPISPRDCGPPPRRRRPPAADVDRARQPRIVHARIVGAAHGMVPPRPGYRQRGRVQYLRRDTNSATPAESPRNPGRRDRARSGTPSIRISSPGRSATPAITRRVDAPASSRRAGMRSDAVHSSITCLPTSTRKCATRVRQIEVLHVERVPAGRAVELHRRRALPEAHVTALPPMPPPTA